MENAKEIKNFIYKELESKKGKIEFSRYFDISFLEWVGTEISLAALKKILSDKDLFQSATGFETMKIPNHLFEFVSLFLSESEGGKILDPWIFTNSVLTRKNFSKFKGYTINQGQYELITRGLNVDSKKIILGDGLSLLEKNNDKYDFICSFPPFGYRSEKMEKNKLF